MFSFSSKWTSVAINEKDNWVTADRLDIFLTPFTTIEEASNYPECINKQYLQPKVEMIDIVENVSQTFCFL